MKINLSFFTQIKMLTKAKLRFFVYLLCILGVPIQAEKVTTSCMYKNIKLKGKVKFVNHFADIKVKFVSSFPDLKVKFVSSFPNSCGEWQIDNSFPDFKIQVVDSFADIQIKVVDSFPGVN